MSRFVDVDLAHCSLLYKVNAAEAKFDVERIFKRGYAWITGTEAGEAPVRPALEAAAQKNGYKLFVYKSNWIAVDVTRITPGSYSAKGNTIIDNDLVAGPGHDTNVVQVAWKDRHLGNVTVLCSHYPTKGRPGAKDPSRRRNVRWTRKVALAISAMGRIFGKGKALCFYGGDQNIPDNISDTFFGGDFTSAWDELDRHEGTGHGNIDVIASWDFDKRVSAKYVRALDDRELFLNTDHYLVEAGYRVLV